MVDGAAVDVAAGFTVEVDRRYVGTGCEDDYGKDDGTTTAPYSLKFVLPTGTNRQALFGKARTYWQRHGYEVGDDDFTSSDPRLHASRGGFEVVLHIPTRGDAAFLGGETPCLPSGD